MPGRTERIVEELFPTKSNIIWHTQQEKLTFPEVTISEIKECAKKIPSGKAPGPDGIPGVIVKMVAAGRPNALCKAYNSCFEEAYFPEAWEVAKLVLLRKGDKPLEQPSSYRPICLLDTVGKFFERVIKRRLELHLSSTNGLSDNQYHFHSGKSTIDAISKAMETVEKASSGPLRRRQLCVLVALDVANAFNSANWRITNRAIGSKGVPDYLRRIIQSYLHNRKLIYGEGNVRGATGIGSRTNPVEYHVR